MSNKVSDFVKAANTVPFAGAGYCAKWVRLCGVAAGIGNFYGNAEDYFKAYCKYETTQLKKGMILACDDSPTSTYGHVGIYVGDNQVRENTTSGLKTTKLSNWIYYNSQKSKVKCGWLGNVVLTDDTANEVFELSAMPVLYKGVKNKKAAIKALQSLLCGYGYSINVDGVFGSDTYSKLTRYQKAQGLQVDGVCGVATWKRLLLGE